MNESLYYREAGDPNGETIVFVHGGGFSGALWNFALQELTEFHCLAPDLPGFGGSAHLLPFSREKSVAGLADLIRTRAPAGRAALVGISVGTVVALGLLDRHPDLVERAFLSGPTPELGRLATSVSNALAGPMLKILGSGRGSRFMARSLMGLKDDQIDEFREDLDRLTPEIFAQINAAVAVQGLPHVNRIPSLILAGEKELGAVKKRARQLLQVFENGVGYQVCGLGHVWCLEDSERFFTAVRLWMSGAALDEGFAPFSD